MLSKRVSKYIKSLQLKKFRKEVGFFLVEGTKGVTELLDSDYQVQYLLYAEGFADTLAELSIAESVVQIPVDEEILKQLGTFQSNNTALAVAAVKSNTPLTLVEDEWGIMLDGVQDPGNLGTIIRIADWYGVHKIVCSPETADFYNPKVINASMGSFTRVSLYYADLSIYLKEHTAHVYGALLNGESIYDAALDKPGFLLMGNESKGISEVLRPFVDTPISIPKRGGAESLNVAVATAVICDNFFR